MHYLFLPLHDYIIDKLFFAKSSNDKSESWGMGCHIMNYTINYIPSARALLALSRVWKLPTFDKPSVMRMATLSTSGLSPLSSLKLCVLITCSAPLVLVSPPVKILYKYLCLRQSHFSPPATISLGCVHHATCFQQKNCWEKIACLCTCILKNLLHDPKKRTKSGPQLTLRVSHTQPSYSKVFTGCNYSHNFSYFDKFPPLTLRISQWDNIAEWAKSPKYPRKRTTEKTLV